MTKQHNIQQNEKQNLKQKKRSQIHGIIALRRFKQRTQVVLRLLQFFVALNFLIRVLILSACILFTENEQRKKVLHESRKSRGKSTNFSLNFRFFFLFRCFSTQNLSIARENRFRTNVFAISLNYVPFRSLIRKWERNKRGRNVELILMLMKNSPRIENRIFEGSMRSVKTGSL